MERIRTDPILSRADRLACERFPDQLIAMRIALWNASGLDNLGDWLLDYVNRRELGKRLPGSTFQTFTPWPSKTVPLVKIDSEGHWVGEGQFDAIVIGGGALLIGPPFVHPSLQTCYLGPYPERFRDRCPVIWNGVCSDGHFVPSLAKPWRDYVSVAAHRMTYRSVRNRRTAELLQQCGVNAPIVIVPDLVTILPPPTRYASVSCRQPRIGLALGLSAHSESFVAHLESPSSAYDWNPAVRVSLPKGALASMSAPPKGYSQAFVTRIKAAARSIQRHSDLQVCAFGAVYGDDNTARMLSQALDCPMMRFSDPTGQDAMEWIASLDLLIASRLHACVLSLVAGTPFFALDPYFNAVTGTSKLREFMADAELLEGYRPLDSFIDSDSTLDDMLQCAGDRERLRVAHGRFRKAGRSHFDLVANVIQRGSSTYE